MLSKTPNQISDAPLCAGRNQNSGRVPYLRFELSQHARKRISERVGIPSDSVLEIIHTGRAVQLNDPARHFERRGYYLFLAATDKAFYVAVTRPTMQTGLPGIVISVLTMAQYERDKGPAAPQVKLQAARLVLSIADYAEYTGRMRDANQTMKWRRRDLKVAIYGWDSNFHPCHRVLGTPPIPICYVVERGLALLPQHPCFLPWLAQRVASSGVEKVLRPDRYEARLGDEEQVVLDFGCR